MANVITPNPPVLDVHGIIVVWFHEGMVEFGLHGKCMVKVLLVPRWCVEVQVGQQGLRDAVRWR